MTVRPNRAFARIDLIASLVMLSSICALAAVAIANGGPSGHGARTDALIKKDQAQLKHIHTALVVFAGANNGTMPRPGLMNRLAATIDGKPVEIPGRGDEDVAQNTTANLYSMMAMQNFFAPKDIISPLERNPNVTADSDFNYAAFDPAADVYWDPAFTADLATGSNVSYAHMPLDGTRMEQEWRDSMSPAFSVLGNRGPLDGERDALSHTCGPHGHWAGNICFNDNHVVAHSETAPYTVRIGEETVPDNFFFAEDGLRGKDMLISFTRTMKADGPQLQHD